MMYKNKDDFLYAFNNDIQIKPLIERRYIIPLTSLDLKKYSIEVKNDGFYHYSQLIELSFKIRQDVKKERGQEALNRAGKNVGNMGRSGEYDSFNIIKLIDPISPAIKRFLLATLSDNFEKEIEIIRKKYGIISNGFNGVLDKKKYEIWNKMMIKKAKKELKNKTQLDYLIENRLTGYVFGEEGAYSDNIFTSLGMLKEETYKLFWKYNIREGFIPHFYVRFGLNNTGIVRYINDLNNATPFQVSTRWEVKENGSTHIEWANPKKFGIFIDRPVSKDAIIKYIENSSELRKQLNEYYGYVELNENTQRDWLIYKYFKLSKYQQKDISTILEEYGFDKVTHSEVKLTIHRLKKRILEFEKVSG